MTIRDEHISSSITTVALCVPDSVLSTRTLSPWKCNAIRKPGSSFASFVMPPASETTFCVGGSGILRDRKQALKTSHNKKSRGFLLCLFPACTLPQVLCQPETYCSGATVLTQAVPANVAAPERNTPSSNEQKKRTPVWFATCGSADAW